MVELQVMPANPAAVAAFSPADEYSKDKGSFALTCNGKR